MALNDNRFLAPMSMMHWHCKLVWPTAKTQFLQGFLQFFPLVTGDVRAIYINELFQNLSVFP